MGICANCVNRRPTDPTPPLSKGYTYANLPKLADGNIIQMADSMQEVIPNVCMGSVIAAKNKELLESNGITHIIAIGWNLEKYFEDDFEYLLLNKIEDSPESIILSQLGKCFNFMDKCMEENGKLFVHCHKGLSRSATVVIAYEMRKTKLDFETVHRQIKKRRPFIMPNIGFQAQMHEFYENDFSLNMESYDGFDVINYIKERLPGMLERITVNYKAYNSNKMDGIDENELFELTLYTHQCHKLQQKEKLNTNDIAILNESIQILRKIQVEFVQDEMSIKRFDIMFS
eukprot:UN00969